MLIPTCSPSYAWTEEDLSWPVTTDVGRGFEGVIAGTTRVSWVDPASGALTYRGVPVEDLAGGTVSFEEVAHLLITGRKPVENPEAYRLFCDQLRASRILPDEVIHFIRTLPGKAHPARLLRAGLSALGCHELEASSGDLAGWKHWRELRIVGQVVALAGVVKQHCSGEEVGQCCSASESLPQCLLEQIHGGNVDDSDVELLNKLWILYADHGLDAPTFTSLVVASCLADPYYNIIAGLSSLPSSKIGSAGERVVRQLFAAMEAADVRMFVEEQLRSGERIAGYGHRFYRMPDPRVGMLRRALAETAERKGRSELFVAARELENAATRLLTGRGIYININFYAAPLFYLLGIMPEFIPVMLIVPRMAGIVARVREQLAQNRLFRPRLVYNGEMREWGDSHAR